MRTALTLAGWQNRTIEKRRENTASAWPENSKSETGQRRETMRDEMREDSELQEYAYKPTHSEKMNTLISGI